MTTKRYLVEVMQEILTPVSVDASSSKEAEELALSEHGEPADCCYSEPKVVSVRRIDWAGNS
jgi:hypothetical protein